MKTILVATDFTPAATNAMLYAVKLARPFNAKVVLYHAYLNETYVPDFVLLPNETNLQEEGEKLLQLELAVLDPVDRLIVETKCEPGIASNKILEAAKELDAGLLVAGMKKDGKTYRKIFGSTALTLCRKSTIPVLVIPEECRFEGIKSIALAADLHLVNNAGFDETIIGFAERFHSEVYIVNVIKKDATSDGPETGNAFDLSWRLKELSPGFKFIEDENVGHALGNFITEKQVSMLAMFSSPHSLLENLFVKSNIKEMMFEGSVPLLVLPGKINPVRGEIEPNKVAQNI